MSRLTPSLLALDKGLDLQTAKIIAPEGSVFDTINYEQVDFQGQKRIDGYTRYDGSALSAVDEYRVMIVDSINGPSTDRDLLFYEDKLLGVIGQQEGTTLRYTVIDHNIEVLPDTAVQVVGYSANGEASSWTANVISDVAGQEASLDTTAHYEHLLSIMSSLRSKVEELPGPIAGLHWFQDRLYAVADVTTVTLVPSLSGDLPNGINGEIGTYQYQVLGGTAPYAFTISAGNLPPSSSIDSSGIVNYSYTTEGDFNWTVKVTDSEGQQATLSDSNTVGDFDTWFGSTSGGSAVLVKGKYKFGNWQTLPAFPSSFVAAYLYSAEGLLHASGPSNPSYRYSADGGVTWILPDNSGGVSGGGGKMAFLNGFAFLCAGVNKLKRRTLPSGDWTIPSDSNASRANTIVTMGSEIIVASLYNTGVSSSLNDGATWTLRSAYQNGIVGSPVLAHNGTRLVVIYNNAVAGGGMCHIKYSDNRGVTWSAPVYTFPNPSTSNVPAELVYDGTYFVAVTSTGQVSRSIDGENWNIVSGITLPTVLSISVGNGMMMAACGSNGFKYSQDHGVTWQTRSLPSGATGANSITWVAP